MAGSPASAARTTPDQTSYAYGSRAKTWFERWEDSRTKCIADVCMFAYACPVATQRERYIRKRDCFHHRPDWERPPVGYSPLAMRLLSGYQGKHEELPETPPQLP